MQKDDVREAQKIPAEEASPALLGLAPTDAREWLELQSVLAWEPERLVIAHGACARENATRTLARALAWM